MSHFLDRLTFFNRVTDKFSDGHGITTNEDRRWEDGYRKRWQHDKIVRSTHGANCTGSCSWKIYVKGGIVTWETQQTDYPRTRPELPNHEPRGCSRGASYSWYLYSGNRVKYPLVRSRLLKLWREARALLTPVAAWGSIVEDPQKRSTYTEKRGLGGFVRATWDEVNEIIAAANAYTVKKYGPDRVIGFSPIPAMSMVSYAAGSRYLSLLGGVCMSFYDWYCDLPPSSPQTWGEQTDVPEMRRLVQFRLPDPVGIERPADAHARCAFLYRGALSRRQERRHLPGLFGSLEVRRSVDLGEAGHRRGARHGDGPRHPARVPPRPAGRIFRGLRRAQYTDMPMLVRLVKQGDAFVPDRFCAPPTSPTISARPTIPNGRPSPMTRLRQASSCRAARSASAGARRASGISRRSRQTARDESRFSLRRRQGRIRRRRFSLFRQSRARSFRRHRPSGRTGAQGAGQDASQLKDGEALVASVFDLFVANYGLDRGFGGEHVAKSYDENVPYTPAWAEKITGVPRDQIITVAREFALNAEKTKGRSMVIIGAAMNHWYHCDMNYRGVINMLVMCGCVGQSGGGWSHYVGQEKLRPQSGWTAARVCARLGPSAAPAELNLVLLRAHRSVALRDARRRRDPLADGAGRPLGRSADRLQRPRRAHGLVAVGAAAQAESA